jgi:hypothetical protein
LFFQYGLWILSTMILNYSTDIRCLRYLIVMSIPATLITANLLNLGQKKYIKIKILLIIFIFISSIHYSDQCRTFIRNGMGDVRETVKFLMGLPPKKIYVPDEFTVSKFKFYSKYNDSFMEKIVVYSCDDINCNDRLYASGKYINDSYVVTYSTTYTYAWAFQNNYPPFMKNPPNYWILLKTIKLKNYGFFNRYDPKIYYAPIYYTIDNKSQEIS